MAANKIDIPDGWEVKKLGEVGKIIGGGTPDTKIDEYWSSNTEKNSIIWLTPTEITKKYTTDSIRKITLQGLNKSSAKMLPINTILITTRATIGAISIAKIECTTNQGFQSLVCDHKYVDYEFMYYMLHQYINTLKRLANGSTFIEISANEIRKIKLILPPLAEQEKIAEILSLWDKAIEQTKELIAYKEKQKKGLMQKYIYPTKNKVSYRIGKLFNLSRGRVISKQEIEENQGIYPVYSSQTSNNGILGFINTYDYDDELITWTTDGANAGKVFARKGKFNCTNVCGIAIPKNRDLCNLLYVTSFLNNITKKYVSYVGNPKLMNNVFEEIEIFLPPLDEQKAIADILCKADEEIELLKKQLDLYTEQKKGLMQNLLTGKVRVTV